MIPTTQGTLRSTDGRTVRVEFDSYSLSLDDARALAGDLSQAVTYGRAAGDRHERRDDLED